LFSFNILISVDGKPVNYSLIETDKLAESLGKNKSLNGRPKIIILDCCRGNELNVGQTKSSGEDLFLYQHAKINYFSCTIKAKVRVQKKSCIQIIFVCLQIDIMEAANKFKKYFLLIRSDYISFICLKD
jgi:hypothetical protein